MRHHLVSFLLLAGVLAGCSGEGLPTGPSEPPAPAATRIINVTGNLAFGDVQVGGSRTATMTISNSGNSPLTVRGLAVTGGLGPHLTASWTSGAVAAGGSQTVTIRFAPTASGAFSGEIVVNGDQTSGANALPVSGSSLASFAGTWTGSHVSTACHGTGSAQDLICGAARGAYKVGTPLYFSVTLTQNGTSVSGIANVGGPSGPVTGTIVGNTLTLSGTLRDQQGFTSTITSWSTTVNGGSLAGTIGYTLTYNDLPGNAAIVANLSNVTRR